VRSRVASVRSLKRSCLNFGLRTGHAAQSRSCQKSANVQPSIPHVVDVTTVSSVATNYTPPYMLPKPRPVPSEWLAVDKEGKAVAHERTIYGVLGKLQGSCIPHLCPSPPRGSEQKLLVEKVDGETLSSAHLKDKTVCENVIATLGQIHHLGV